MKFELPNGNFAIVSWKYDTRKVTTVQGTELGETEVTTACVRTVDAQGNLVADDVCGSVSRYKYDVFDKDVARKESLRKALDVIYPLRKVNIFGTPSPSQLKELTDMVKEQNAPNKALRSLFWDAYLTRNDKFLAKSKQGLPV